MKNDSKVLDAVKALIAENQHYRSLLESISTKFSAPVSAAKRSPTGKKRGRPAGSKNKPKAVAAPVAKPAAKTSPTEKPAKPAPIAVVAKPAVVRRLKPAVSEIKSSFADFE